MRGRIDAEIAREIIRNRMGALALREVPPAGWDPDVIASVKEQARRASMHVSILELEVTRIARRLAATPGVSMPILLKGGAIAARYAVPSDRHFKDIDILVPRSELAAVAAALAESDLKMNWPSELRDTARGFDHHLKLRRAIGGGSILCEVHWCLGLEKNLRALGYGDLVDETEIAPSGIRVLGRPAQLLVVALHLSHHVIADRRLICFRDVVELADPATTEATRVLADRLGLRWFLERILLDTEEIIGEARWGAMVNGPAPSRTAAFLAAGGTGIRYQLNVARDLGPRGGAAYIASRVDPRRFARDSSYDWEALRATWRRLRAGVVDAMRRDR